MVLIWTSVLMVLNVTLRYYLKTEATMMGEWSELFKFIFSPKVIIFFGLVGPLVLWTTAKLQYDYLGENIWLTTIIYSFIVTVGTIGGVWLSSGQRPDNKDLIAIVLMSLIIIWRSVD